MNYKKNRLLNFTRTTTTLSCSNIMSPPTTTTTTYTIEERPRSTNQSTSTPTPTPTTSTTVQDNPVVVTTKTPYLMILENPQERFQFYYKSEINGSRHVGTLYGQNSTKTKKTYPSVELRDYNGEDVFIRCTLNQIHPNKRSPHSHNLIVFDKDTPYNINVSKEENYKASYKNMYIIHTAKKDTFNELSKKMIQNKQMELGRKLFISEMEGIKQNAIQETKTINLNQCCLCFEAFIVKVENNISRWRQLCPPVYSNTINNHNNNITGELLITRLSVSVGSAAGGDDLILFVQRINKNTTKVRFFELNSEGQEIWQSWGIFSDHDVHHDYAIALQTPSYKNIDILEPVNVFVQLYRITDNHKSEAIPFKYQPIKKILCKRPRIDSDSNETPTRLIRDIKPSAIHDKQPLMMIKCDPSPPPPPPLPVIHRQQQQQQQQQQEQQQQQHQKQPIPMMIKCDPSPPPPPPVIYRQQQQQQQQQHQKQLIQSNPETFEKVFQQFVSACRERDRARDCDRERKKRGRPYIT